MMTREFNWNIERNIGIISVNCYGWSKELNIVSWNDMDAKYDIRDWSKGHVNMSKGITLTKEEARKVYEFLKGEFENETGETENN